MKRYLIIITLVISSLFVCNSEAAAQEFITVKGKITGMSDLNTGLGRVSIYYYKTVDEATYFYYEAIDKFQEKKMNDFYQANGQGNFLSRDNGNFETTYVDPFGALLFIYGSYEPVLVEINARTYIDVEINDLEKIKDATLVAETEKKANPRVKKPVDSGGHHTTAWRYTFSADKLGTIEKIGRTNARLVTQMYVVSYESKDTLMYMPAMVHDGIQYHNTQALWNRDTLYNIADKNICLDSLGNSFVFNVDFKTAGTDTTRYICKANVWIEDYIKTYYKDELPDLYDTGRSSRPYQFLEYSVGAYDLPFDQYIRKATPTFLPTEKNMKLEFEVGKAQLKLTDSATVATLDSLKGEFRQIRVSDDQTLTSLAFEGTSSPEGVYFKNLDLSKRRTQTVINEVLSVIPEGRKALKPSRDSVAGWDKVADIFEKDSLLSEAKQIRDIVAQYPENLDRQMPYIRKLPFYEKEIKPRLGELRSVKCKYEVRIFRPRKPAEIIELYNEDKEAILSGKRLLDLSYYWTLFQHVKDPVELESLCKSAMKVAKFKKDKWALPANILSTIYINKKQIDTTLLTPYLIPGYPLEYSETDMTRTDVRYIYNAPEVIANHVQMLMMAHDYDNAVSWTELVKAQYPLLNAVCKLLGGYIKDLTTAENKAMIELIKKSSVRNHVIMELHHSEKINKDTLAPLLQQLPQDDALTDYLKAQRLCLQCELDLQQMKMLQFAREEDRGLMREGEYLIPAPTPEQIEATRAEIETLKTYIEEDKLIGLDTSENERKVAKLQQDLRRMEKGEVTYHYLEKPLYMYDAAKFYLQRCFQKDKKFITIARRDYDIVEDLFYDAIGKEKPKK